MSTQRVPEPSLNRVPLLVVLTFLTGASLAKVDELATYHGLLTGKEESLRLSEDYPALCRELVKSRLGETSRLTLLALRQDMEIYRSVLQMKPGLSQREAMEAWVARVKEKYGATVNLAPNA